MDDILVTCVPVFGSFLTDLGTTDCLTAGLVGIEDYGIELLIFVNYYHNMICSINRRWAEIIKSLILI